MTDVQFVPSRRVHSVLRKLLWPYFSTHGWAKRPGSTCAFVRAASQGYWCLWVQISQFGGKTDGNSFTLNLVRRPSIDAPLTGGQTNARIPVDLLSPEDKARGRALAEEIQARIPDPPPDDKVHEWKKLPGKEGLKWIEYLARIRQVPPSEWEPGIDVWLNYYSVTDLEQWVEFLLPRFDKLLSECDVDGGWH